MHDRASGEIKRAKDPEPPADAPDPVSERVIYEGRPQQRENEERGELHPFGEGSRYKRGRYHGEHHLEEHERLMRDSGGGIRGRGLGYAREPEELEAAYETQPVRGEREACSEEQTPTISH